MENNAQNPEKPQNDAKLHVVGSADINNYLDDDDWDDEDTNGCCDDCGCYHGHHPWCGHSDEYDDW